MKRNRQVAGALLGSLPIHSGIGSLALAVHLTISLVR